MPHIGADFLSDVGHVQMDLFEKIGVLLHLRREFGVLLNEGFDVVRVVRRMQSDFGGDGVGSLGGNHFMDLVSSDDKIAACRTCNMEIISFIILFTLVTESK